MTPKEYLEQYRTLDAEINSKREQIERINAIATKVSPSTGFGSSGEISDRVGKAAAKIVDLEREIVGDIERLVALKAEIRTQISSVANSAYRYILEEHYFNNKTFDVIGEQIGYSRMQICRMHGTALTYITPPRKKDVTNVTNVVECYKKM